MEIERFEKQFNSLNDEALAKAYNSRSQLCPEAQAALQAVAYSRGLTPENLKKFYSVQPLPMDSAKKAGRKILVFVLLIPVLLIGGGISGLISYYITPSYIDPITVLVVAIFTSTVIIIAVLHNKIIDLINYLRDRNR